MQSVSRKMALLTHQYAIYLHNALAGMEIDVAEFKYLVTLFEEDGLSQEALSARLQIDKAATARTICRLEKKGLVLRQRCDTDKRVKTVFLTDRCRALQPTIEAVVDRWVSAINESVPPDERGVLSHALDCMNEQAEELNRAFRREGA